MTRPNPLSDQPHDRNDPFGLSKFSIRRYSVQHILLLFSVIGLLIATNVQAVLHGNVTLMVLAGTTLAVTLVKTGVVLYAGIRTVAVEIWIRRLGMGDFEYRIAPKGNDEVSKACLALETLRQSSIRAMQLDLVQKLSDELQEKNATLEDTLDELRKTQDRIISQQKLAELGSCPPAWPTRSAIRCNLSGISPRPRRRLPVRSRRRPSSPRTAIWRRWTS